MHLPHALARFHPRLLDTCRDYSRARFWRDAGAGVTVGIVALPLDCASDLERLAVANLITLTPGTLSLDFSDDNQTLFVHGMFVEDADAVRAELQEGMQRQVTRALR